MYDGEGGREWEVKRERHYKRMNEKIKMEEKERERAYQAVIISLCWKIGSSI